MLRLDVDVEMKNVGLGRCPQQLGGSAGRGAVQTRGITAS